MGTTVRSLAAAAIRAGDRLAAVGNDEAEITRACRRHTRAVRRLVAAGPISQADAPIVARAMFTPTALDDKQARPLVAALLRQLAAA